MDRGHVGFAAIMEQIDFVFDEVLSEDNRGILRKIIVSNNGSVLDDDTFSTTALMYFLAKMNLHCPNISVLSLETRPEYVDAAELEVLSRAIKEGTTPTTLELAVGFEVFDDHIRNEVFNKGLNLETFESLVRMASGYGFSVKAYFMLKPVVALSETEAIDDVKRGIDYLSGLSVAYGVPINMHLNPTYIPAGTVLEEAFLKGEYQPPLLSSVVTVARYCRDKAISLYIGLNDEGLAIPNGSFIRAGDEPVVAMLEEFNATQDYQILDRIVLSGD